MLHTRTSVIGVFPSFKLESGGELISPLQCKLLPVEFDDASWRLIGLSRDPWSWAVKRSVIAVRTKKHSLLMPRLATRCQQTDGFTAQRSAAQNHWIHFSRQVSLATSNADWGDFKRFIQQGCILKFLCLYFQLWHRPTTQITRTVQQKQPVARVNVDVDTAMRLEISYSPIWFWITRDTGIKQKK